MRTLMLAALLYAAAARGQILTTEVWVGNLDRSGGFAVTGLRNVSNEPGYDNQPAFFADGTRLVYASEVSGLADTGLGVHAFLVDLATGARTPVPGARGFSPTPTADGRLTTLREGKVWLYSLDGRELKTLTETNDAGYYTRFDDRTWALFMNDKDRRIVIYDARKKSLETMATGAITAPYRVPGQRAVTFVAEEPFPRTEQTTAARALVLRKLDLKTRSVATLATLPFPTGGHHVWTSRGTLLMASGPAIYEWSPAQSTTWTPVWRAEHPDLQGITRIALSPNEDRIALVSVPRGGTVVREARSASNEALAARNAEAAASFFAADGRLTAANGSTWTGREAIAKEIAVRFQHLSDIVYVRTAEKVEESRADGAVAERGTWSGRWTSDGGPVEQRGDYMAVWRRSVGENGTPAWHVQSELFVALDCSGAGCAR